MLYHVSVAVSFLLRAIIPFSVYAHGAHLLVISSSVGGYMLRSHVRDRGSTVSLRESVFSSFEKWIDVEVGITSLYTSWLFEDFWEFTELFSINCSFYLPVTPVSFPLSWHSHLDRYTFLLFKRQLLPYILFISFVCVHICVCRWVCVCVWDCVWLWMLLWKPEDS